MVIVSYYVKLDIQPLAKYHCNARLRVGDDAIV